VTSVTDRGSDIGAAIGNEDGDKYFALAIKNLDGGIVTVFGGLHMAADGSILTIWFGDDGLPLMIIIQDWVIRLTGYTEDTVDVTVASPDGVTTFHPEVAVDAESISLGRALAAGGTIGADNSFPNSPAVAPNSHTQNEFAAVASGLSAVIQVGMSMLCEIASSDLWTSVGAEDLLVCPSETMADATALIEDSDFDHAVSSVSSIDCILEGQAACEHALSEADTLYLESRATRSFYEQTVGRLSGLVRDAETFLPLPDARVVGVQETVAVTGDTTGPNGGYEIVLPEGTDYRLDVSRIGYLPASLYGADVSPLVVRNLETLFLVGAQFSGPGDFSGLATNALNGDPVEDASIEFRSGINARTGTVVASATTDSSGDYSVSGLEGGVYTGEVNATDFATTYFTATCLGGQTTENQNVVITPFLSAGEIRIVLTWGSTPTDLDSHLTGPTLGEDRFHVYWLEPGSVNTGPFAALDVDDITSFGPETITIYQRREGTYRYTVHDYRSLSEKSLLTLLIS
jgi:hypothetical protein